MVEKISLNNQQFQTDLEKTLLCLIEFYRDLGYPFSSDDRIIISKAINVLRAKLIDQ